MPVKLDAIHKVSDPTNPEVISLAEYETGRANFVANYFLANCGTGINGQDFQVAWADFYSAVNGFIVANSLDPATVALRFVYCYNPTGTLLYLRMQICTMVSAVGTPGTYNLVTSTCAWYQLQNNSITTTTNTTLSDANYLNDFYYCGGQACGPTTAVNLATDTADVLYARTVTFPWAAEILAMYEDNGLTGDGYICFGATSYMNGGGGSAPILYPHGMVMYLRNSAGQALLDNNSNIAIFSNKGCDMGTMCPSACNVYVTPAGS